MEARSIAKMEWQSDIKQPISEDRPGLWSKCCVTSVVSLLAWIPCDVVGGLIFLSMGVRLWSYHVAPLFWDLTSFAGWAMVIPVLGINCCVFLLWERRHKINGARRWLYRAVFLMISGPINEVVWSAAFRSIFDRQLYSYTILPTFEGMGSILSPLYYLTLLLGFWIDEWIPGSVGYRKRS